MDIKQLRYFNEIARNGSIAKAANKIYISQQGLSMAMLRLESELSCRLLERTPEGMTLTREGEFLLPRSEEIVAKFDAVEAYFKTGGQHRSTVRVACALGATPEVLAQVLVEFQRDCPQYFVEVDEGSDVDCDDAVENKRAELGLGIGPLDEKKFVTKKLFSSPFCLLVHRSHPLANLKTVTVDVLQNLPVMVMNDRMKSSLLISRCCEARGFQLEIQYRAAEIIAIHRMAAAQVGVGVGVLSVAQGMEQPDVVAIPFEEPEMTWQLYLFKLRGAVLSPGAKAFEGYVLRTCGG